MAWTLGRYLDRRAKEMQNLKLLVFGTIFSAFAAGAELVYGLEEGRRTPSGIAFACFFIVLFLASSLECGYLLLRAARRNQVHNDTSSTS